MSFYIIKASGEQELFDARKFRYALQRAGASLDNIEELLDAIQAREDLRSTQAIYNYALQRLKEQEPVAAHRYNIRNALEELGPVGYPFELFISELFKAWGYEVQTNQMVQGWCVEHEVDVIATKDNQLSMIECKFHGRRGLKTSVKVALYIKARFDDVAKQCKSSEDHEHTFHHSWLVSNTRFTSEAIKYALCTGIKLMGWSYPEKDNIRDLIDSLGLYPVTALTSLNAKQKKFLISHGLLLCRDISKHTGLLRKARLNAHEVEQLVQEAQAVCEGRGYNISK